MSSATTKWSTIQQSKNALPVPRLVPSSMDSSAPHAQAPLIMTKPPKAALLVLLLKFSILTKKLANAQTTISGMIPSAWLAFSLSTLIWWPKHVNLVLLGLYTTSPLKNAQIVQSKIHFSMGSNAENVVRALTMTQIAIPALLARVARYTMQLHEAAFVRHPLRFGRIKNASLATCPNTLI